MGSSPVPRELRTRRGTPSAGCMLCKAFSASVDSASSTSSRPVNPAALHALKTLRDEYLKDSETRELFRREARVWVGLDRHPNIVRAEFITELSGRLYIGMEYVEPGDQGRNSLAGYLATQPPDMAQALRWSIQFCHGMEYARSRGIRCHRDVKPENIMITRDRTVKITDFGFAGVIEHVRAGSSFPQRRRSVQRSGFGTPAYMPPEQFRNASRCDERSDIYSFGIVMFQMASRGRFPFALRGRHSGKNYWNDMHRLHAEGRSSPFAVSVLAGHRALPAKRTEHALSVVCRTACRSRCAV